MKPTKEELQARQERQKQAKEKYAERLRFQEKLKAGREFFHEGRCRLETAKFGDVIVSFVISVTPETKRTEVVWCVCSPKDTYSPRTARGYIGMRMMERDMNWTVILPNGKLTSCQAAHAFIGWLFWTAACSNHGVLPKRLQRALLKEGA